MEGNVFRPERVARGRNVGQGRSAHRDPDGAKSALVDPYQGCALRWQMSDPFGATSYPLLPVSVIPWMNAR